MNTEGLDLNKIKQVSVHDGLLEAIILLKQARSKIDKLTDEEEIQCYPKGYHQLSKISDNVISYEKDIAEIMSLYFSERADAEIDRQIAERNK